MTTILHVIDGQEHPAAMTSLPDSFKIGGLLSASMWCHLDGSPGVFGEVVKCGTCGVAPKRIRVDLRPQVFFLNGEA